MEAIAIVNEYYVRICTIAVNEELNLSPGDELRITINRKNIPFKVVENGGIKTLMEIDFITKNELYSDRKISANIINIISFDELKKMVE